MLAFEVEVVSEEELPVRGDDTQAGHIVEEGRLVHLVSERFAGVVDGRRAGHRLVAARDLDVAVEVDDVPGRILPAIGVEHLDEELPGAGRAENRGGRRVFGQDKGLVEAYEPGEQTADHEDEQGQMADKRPVGGPGVSLGEEVRGAIPPRGLLHRVTALTQGRRDGAHATRVCVICPMVSDLEVTVRDFALRAVDASRRGPKTADR